MARKNLSKKIKCKFYYFDFTLITIINIKEMLIKVILFVSCLLAVSCNSFENEMVTSNEPIGTSLRTTDSSSIKERILNFVASLIYVWFGVHFVINVLIPILTMGFEVLLNFTNGISNLSSETNDW